MVKRTMALSLSVILSVALFFVVSFVLQTVAQPQLKAAEAANYNVKASLADNLKSFTGKKVSLTLNSGQTLRGFVKEVGENLVHLEKLDGKEYFDALIRIKTISAIDARFRK